MIVQFQAKIMNFPAEEEMTTASQQMHYSENQETIINEYIQQASLIGTVSSSSLFILLVLAFILSFSLKIKSTNN